MLIFIVGLMGSGKSFLGKQWSDKHQLAFYDLDKMIEQSENATIKQIFERKGENYFREVEAKELRKTNVVTNAIISCGGGTACFFNNMDWMNKNGITVFLNPLASTIFANLLPEKSQRPLIANLNDKELMDFINLKLVERLPFYTASKISLQSEYLNESGFQFI